MVTASMFRVFVCIFFGGMKRKNNEKNYVFILYVHQIKHAQMYGCSIFMRCSRLGDSVKQSIPFGLLVQPGMQAKLAAITASHVSCHMAYFDQY